MKADYICSIDQGTTSTRCILFDKSGTPAGSDRMEHKQLYPQPGWVEHDPCEIWNNTQAVIGNALQKAGVNSTAIAAVGITNQRETTVAWDKSTGKPLYNAIVWMDTRTLQIVKRCADKLGGLDVYRLKTGLPFSTYFSVFKLLWLIENIPDVKKAVDHGTALFGTIDSWLIWNLTAGKTFATDVTNASRTLLMDLHSLSWDQGICDSFSIPVNALPAIRSNSENYGYTDSNGPFNGSIPITGSIGDQQAATVGQACFTKGDSKNTYGTGCFMIHNTGTDIRVSKNGLLTTVGYKFGAKPAVYALEGSVAIAGALVQWLRDNLQIINSSSEIEQLARSVDDNGGIFFVPAFSGLYAPYWRSDARGVITGMTRFANKGHLARAVLEATAFQTRDVLDAMISDSGAAISCLRVDGGMTVNELLMQFQADVLQVPIVRPKVIETTALGAAYAAGLAVGFWNSEKDIQTNWTEDKRWEPDRNSPASDRLYTQWKKAITRSYNWID